MTREEHAYLSIVQWPSNLAEPARVEALVLALGMDQDTAQLVARRGTPQVAARISSLIRDEVLRVLTERGVMAFAPTQSELIGAGPVRRIKSLAVGGGGITCQMWRCDPVTIDPAELLLVVRGRIKSITTRTTIGHTNAHMGALTWTVGGPELALGMALARAGEGASVDRRSDIAHSEQAELFMRNNTRLRLDADKLSFGVLGDQRGYSDHVNMDRLIELVRHLAPHAIVDDGFGAFRSPPDILREHARSVGGVSISSTTDQPAFEFYAPWANILYRRMLGL